MNCRSGRSFVPSSRWVQKHCGGDWGASQDVAVQALVCSSDLVGTICISGVANFIHFIRSLVWGCGRDQSFDARVG
jgi:hypothetical protein